MTASDISPSARRDLPDLRRRQLIAGAAVALAAPTRALAQDAPADPTKVPGFPVGANDGYGHPVGDAVLRTVGALIRERCEDCDRYARYGGDEFVLVLPAPLDQARAEVAGVVEEAVAGVRVVKKREGGIVCRVTLVDDHGDEEAHGQ